jgi:hypothetical protein
MRDDVKSLNLRRIEYYTPYSRQVLPTHRKTVRMNLKLITKEDLLWKISGTEWYPREQDGITLKVTRAEWYHKGSNHTMKDIQGC